MAATWNEHRREANLLKHGLGFADFDASFDAERAFIRPTRPSRTGRSRYLLIGEWNGALVVVIVSPLGTEAFGIASIRPADTREKKSVTTTNRKPEGVSFSQEDWDEVSDSPGMTDAELAELKPLKEGAPEIYRPPTKRGRGRPRVETLKVNLTLRVDPVVLDACKATGAGWQTRMHEALARGGGRVGAMTGEWDYPVELRRKEDGALHA